MAPGDSPFGSAFDDYYAILRLEPGATLEQIKAAYRDFAFIFHPDRLPLDRESARQRAEACLKRVNEAYDVLTEHSGNATYDSQRRSDDWSRRGPWPADTGSPTGHHAPPSPGSANRPPASSASFLTHGMRAVAWTMAVLGVMFVVGAVAALALTFLLIVCVVLLVLVVSAAALRG